MPWWRPSRRWDCESVFWKIKVLNANDYDVEISSANQREREHDNWELPGDSEVI